MVAAAGGGGGSGAGESRRPAARRTYNPLPGGVRLAPLAPSMLGEFQALHADLFPVKYGRKFYDELFYSPLHVALVALAPDNSDASTGSGNNANCPPPHDLKSAEPDTADERIVGVATGRVKVTRGTCTERRLGYIMTLGTHSSLRGQGIGGCLLDELCRQLSEYGRAAEISLHCTTVNDAAISLYRARDFRITQRLENHYHFYGEYHDAYELIRDVQRDRQSCCTACCSGWFCLSFCRRPPKAKT